MNAPADDFDALLDTLTESLTTLIVEANNALRTVWAIRRERESQRVVVHDSSVVPDDFAVPHACDDEPPEAHHPGH